MPVPRCGAATVDRPAAAAGRSVARVNMIFRLLLLSIRARFGERIAPTDVARTDASSGPPGMPLANT